jgi:glycerol-3-phosphate acyltransferase PlsY
VSGTFYGPCYRKTNGKTAVSASGKSLDVMANAWLLGLIVAGYFIGSIPFGLVVGLAKGIDPRTSGSGNIGATNVGRLLGGRYFALVFTLDLLKGMIPVLAAGAILHWEAAIARDYLLWLLVGAAAIVGHMFSIFLKFKGGKGVATSAGVLLGVFPYYTIPGIIAVVVFVAVFYTTRYVSLGSILGSIAFPLAYVAVGLVRNWPITRQQLPLLIFSVVIPAMIVYKHRANIARLRAGTENRIAKRAAGGESVDVR